MFRGILTGFKDFVRRFEAGEISEAEFLAIHGRERGAYAGAVAAECAIRDPEQCYRWLRDMCKALKK